MNTARIQVAPGVYREEAEEVTPGEHNDEVANQLQHMSFHDLLDQIAEVGDQLMPAIQSEDAETIGQIVLAVRRTYAERCADHELFGNSWRQTTKEAAAKVLLERAAVKQSDRRFTGEPITGFGGLR